MRLLAADDPALLLRSWLVKRAVRRVYSAAPEDMAALLADDRVVRPGVSDSAVGISISDEAEGYVALADERNIVDEYLLLQVAPHNVVLHVVPDDGWLSLDEIGFGKRALAVALKSRRIHSTPSDSRPRPRSSRTSAIKRNTTWVGNLRDRRPL
jgi:hypothetical protein